jgi:hypothetical protein
MKRMGSSNVLIVGLKGLGVEIGKYTGFHLLDVAHSSLQRKTLLLPVLNPSLYTIPPLSQSPICRPSSSFSLRMLASRVLK